MMLKFLLLAVLGLASVTADFNATATLDFSAIALDQANCAAKAYGYDATTHDKDGVQRPGALWNDFEGGDYSGFVYGSSGEFGLTIAIPTIYEAERTTVAFEDAATAGGAASDMTSAISGTDSWECSTCQAWYGNANAPIDAGVCTEDAFGDCFAVFRFKRNWALFTADMGIGAGKGLERLEYGGAPDINTNGGIDPQFNGGGGSAPGAQKFIEFCGEMVVTMKEQPQGGWDQEGTSSFDASDLQFERSVTDRFVFCLVFQTRVTVSTDLTIHDQPDYFQLLRIQDNAELDPDSATCPAKYELSIITLVQAPYELENFLVDADDATTPYAPEHNSLTFARQLDKGYDASDCAPGASNCAQDWGISFCLVDCEADGNLVLDFEVTCRAGLPADECPLATDVTTHVGGVITLDSASFCAILIENINVEGTLTSYEDAGLTTAKDTFVTGDSVCFKGAFNAIDEDGADLESPPICGVSIMQISLAATSLADGGYFTEDIWTGPAWPSSANAPYTDTDVGTCTTAGRSCSYGTYAANSNTLNLAILNYATGNTALGASSADAFGTVKNIGFCYDLDDVLLAPEDHGSFELTTNVLVEVVFCDTATTLLSLAYPYKEALYQAAGHGQELLALDDQAQNPNEVAATLGMTSLAPITPVVDVGGTTEVEPPVVQPVTKPANDIWPIIAGIIGAVSVVIIVLLVAMRRRRTDNVKTVAVIPNANYGQVAVVTQNNAGAVP